ncbi:MAG: KUP/HAK/KT family potassium transporter [Phycisphaeraceae bacterium]|nr:KUP/HAK/KT family potassium transporter [Phycisphaeraceae bacterium]
MSIAALGVVFGDIGTSPLYAIKECIEIHLHGQEVRAVEEEFIRGILSLVFWSIVTVVNIKYLTVVMRATNRGEGGLFALLALIPRSLSKRGSKSVVFLGTLAAFGAGLLFGDGIITPSISVLSAVEGLVKVNPDLEPAVVPVTLGILLGLFSVQQFGTGRIGRVFGPVMIVWFTTLIVLGLGGIWENPGIWSSVNPWYALYLVRTAPWETFVILGSVFLVVTGAEALYADVGHFGLKSVRMAWYCLAGPALIINYFGQGAHLLAASQASPEALDAAILNPFYDMAPVALRLPLVVLATTAAIIASQAMISGVFSVARQAVRLGYLPRIQILHMSSEQEGQVYIPSINSLMAVGCVVTVLLFQSSTSLAGAYGIAVSADMCITTIMFMVVARRLWRWRRRYIAIIGSIFLAADLLFLGANLLKIPYGGWFALAIGLSGAIVMLTWMQGSSLVARKLLDDTRNIHVFLATLWSQVVPRVPGTAVFLAGNRNTPYSLVAFVEHSHVLHQQVILLSVVTTNLPVVPEHRKVHVEWLPDGFWRVTVQLGFMESPDVPKLLERLRAHGIQWDPETTTYFARRLVVLPTGDTRMARWRKRLFASLSRGATDSIRFFNLPPQRVVEFGTQVEI